MCETFLISFFIQISFLNEDVNFLANQPTALKY
jgi:hypothetical protein